MACTVLVLLELGPALALGLLLGRRWPRMPARLAPPLVHWGVPFSLTGLLLRAGLDWRYAQEGLLALVAVAVELASDPQPFLDVLGSGLELAAAAAQ